MKRAVAATTIRGVDVSDVACVIPTRGDVDLTPIVNSLPFAEVFVWDNSERDDLGVYARYEAIEHVDAPVIYTQDDDALLPDASIDALLAAYRPGRVVCNIPDKFRRRYTDSGLVGFGAVFDRDLPFKAFNHDALNMDVGVFRRTCDIVFTMLTPMVQVDVPYDDLEHAHADNRMWRQTNHFEEREDIRQLCRSIVKASA